MIFNYTRLFSIMILLAGALGMLAGCGGGAGLKLSDAALSGDPEAMWVEGQKTVASGEALVNKGEAQLAEGRQQVREGEAAIRAGNQRVLQARRDYQAAVAAAGGSATPADVAAEAMQLKNIGKRWEDAIDDIKDGNKLVDKGNKNIDSGQSEVRAGRRLMESGSTLMRNSQRTRMGEPLLPDIMPEY